MGLVDYAKKQIKVDIMEQGKDVLCPECDGTGESFATGIQYAEGHSGPYCDMLPCLTCFGKKSIPTKKLGWIERGSEIRQWRRNNEFTLHEAAKRVGLKPSEVSAIEWGRVDNTNWRSLLNAND